jgi:uncharacterized membrane protein YesL
MSNLSKKGFWELYYKSIPFISLNVLWFLLTLPLITAFPAVAGLFYATNQLAHGKTAGWGDFMDGFRRYFWISWRWGMLNILVLLVGAVNIWFYGQVETGWADIIRGINIGLVFIWGSSQIFTFPFLIEQEDRRLKVAIRNILVMYLRSPLRSFGLALGLSVLILLAARFFVPALVFFGVSFIAYYANQFIINTINDLSWEKDDKNRSPIE